jgi:glycopeptide antibiotics resistance protein
MALGYSAFVIYGMLVPLHFTPRPLRDAWDYFQHIPYLELDIGSRADWVANILLFIPLAFFWLGALWPNRGSIARVLVTAWVWFCAFALSVAIEFTQIFFPPRTVSQNDIVAESAGAAIGIAVWWWAGPRFALWLDEWGDKHRRASAPERFLHLYLFLLLGYSVLPLDLTTSSVEIYHKWAEGKILLVPFSAVYESGAQRAYALLAEIAIWIPAGFLWRLSTSRPGRTIVLYVLACATVMEILHLFVYSRVTATTNVLTAGCGAAIGVALARRLRPNGGAHDARHSPAVIGRAVLLWVLALASWITVLMAVFWYPFNFSNEWGFVHERLATLRRVPFEAYYYGTEFRAVTEVFHKAGFFFPLGALLAVGAIGVRRWLPVPVVLLHAASALFIGGAAAGIEVGKIFLPDKIADATNWMLELLGGLAGYVCLRILNTALRGGHADGMLARTSEPPP